MARRAVVHQVSNFFWAHALVAIQTPTHVLPGLRLGGAHLAYVTVAGFTGHSGNDMRLVIKMHEVGL
jgi:hypothetical protein